MRTENRLIVENLSSRVSWQVSVLVVSSAQQASKSCSTTSLPQCNTHTVVVISTLLKDANVEPVPLLIYVTVMSIK